MVTLSTELQRVIEGKSPLLIRSITDYGTFGVSWFHHGSGVILISFDPWNGAELYFINDSDMLKEFIRGLTSGDREYEKICKNKLDFFARRFGYIKNLTESSILWNEDRLFDRNQHKFSICKTLSYYIDGGYDDGMTSLIHIPNIRTYAVLNKKEYGGWTAMDYCPFCGAKFPERLDKKLTEILQNEYGLTSWRDYKQAPHEFDTDEWWKKRGL